MENKTTWKENRPLAWLMLALAVLVGVLGIGTAKVRGVAGTALDYYNQNMAADFTARETAAQTILGIAGQELGEDDAKVQTAAAALAESQAATAPGEKYAAGTKLETAVGIVYNALPQAARDPQKSAAQLAWSEFVSRTDILSHSMEEYNTYAQAVQDTIKGFPASLLARLAGVDTQAMA
ncbi:MAG TPA: hypothetical protein H9998_01525 [Candidatus Ruthenibacterium merdipullorum]|nr:hypothetical protein [Candidatus Ruthenibacterium merdipullorum]